MDNQHRKIKGYRELSQAEIDLMNEVKTKGEELRVLLEKCASVDAPADAPRPASDPTLADAARWRAIAKTHFQEGLMALTRSVAKPDFF